MNLSLNNLSVHPKFTLEIIIAVMVWSIFYLKIHQYDIFFILQKLFLQLTH